MSHVFCCFAHGPLAFTTPLSPLSCLHYFFCFPSSSVSLSLPFLLSLFLLSLFVPSLFLLSPLSLSLSLSLCSSVSLCLSLCLCLSLLYLSLSFLCYLSLSFSPSVALSWALLFSLVSVIDCLDLCMPYFCLVSHLNSVISAPNLLHKAPIPLLCYSFLSFASCAFLSRSGHIILFSLSPSCIDILVKSIFCDLVSPLGIVWSDKPS